MSSAVTISVLACYSLETLSSLTYLRLFVPGTYDSVLREHFLVSGLDFVPVPGRLEIQTLRNPGASKLRTPELT